MGSDELRVRQLVDSYMQENTLILEKKFLKECVTEPLLKFIYFTYQNESESQMSHCGVF